MKQIILIIWLFPFAFNCNSNQTRIYKSDDKLTGGFQNIEIKLLGNGEMIIDYKYFIPLRGTENLFESRSIQLNGHWENSDPIICEINIDQNLDSLVNDKLVIFKEKNDTLIAFGIPCILQN